MVLFFNSHLILTDESEAAMTIVSQEDLSIIHRLVGNCSSHNEGV